MSVDKQNLYLVVPIKVIMPSKGTQLLKHTLKYKGKGTLTGKYMQQKSKHYT